MSGERQQGFALRDPLPWDELVATVARAEAWGYGALFLPEISGRDVVATLGALAGETRGLVLATGVLPIGSRSPKLTAMGAATVQERSGGRFVLGLGTGPAAPGALERLREMVGTLRRLLAGETVDVRGRSERLSLDPGAVVPIWISALGPRAMRLAGEVADGVLLNCCTPERVASARVELAEGAEVAGRDPSDITVAVYVRACVDTGEERGALEALAAAIGEYASYPAYARQFEVMGFGEQARAAAAAHSAGRPQDVPESLVRAICLSGDPAAARTRTRGFREAGADVPVVYPVAASGADVVTSVAATLEALAPEAEEASRPQA